MSCTIHHGDCLDVLKTMDENSVDSIVTDPPYGLSFMGKAWDHSVPSAEVWAECLRVLKPGGHLLAFAGTRTQHRMAVNIEDAGFEIRDMIAWVYGSGFPKSLNVGKAIDKMDAVQEQQARRYRFTEWVRSKGVKSAQIDESTGTNMGGHYTTEASQPSIMTREHLEACRHLFDDVPEWVEREADIRSVESKNFAEREVVGKRDVPIGHAFAGKTYGGDSSNKAADITIPSTQAAQQWDGWGTALKPALEPITVARKPFKGTVAGNVLTHGTGAINVDGCRVGTDDVLSFGSRELGDGIKYGKCKPTTEGKQNEQGRWPANFIHDGSDEVVGLFPNAKPARKGNPKRIIKKGMFAENGGFNKVGAEYNDNGGSAARFFYCAKASKRDRDEGVAGVAGVGALRDGGRESQPRMNYHPTVKPTDLMRYLVRLVTPPNGTVLDPFMGSGSTGKGATLEGFHFIGIELDADYIEIARARIDAVDPDNVLS